MTLLELMVVIAIVGIITTVASLAIPRIPQPDPKDAGVALLTARRNALRTGVPASIKIVIDSEEHEITVLTDGSVAADSAVPMSALTARWNSAR